MNGVHTTDPISTPNDNEYETLQNNHRIDDSTNGHAAMLAGFGPSPPRLPSSPVDSETHGRSTHGADNGHPCEQPPHPEPASAHGPAYLQNNRYLTIKHYARMTGLSKQMAEAELDSFCSRANGMLKCQTAGSKKVYSKI